MKNFVAEDNFLEDDDDYDDDYDDNDDALRDKNIK